MSGCEACNPDAELAFDWILSEIMNRLGTFEFVLAAARCFVTSPVTEKTLVDRGGSWLVQRRRR
jgi:hypothetical protein